MNANTIIVEELYQAPLEKVWHALTDKDQMKQWYFDIPDFRLQEGAVFNFYEPGGYNRFHHQCTIKEINLFKKFVHTWRYPEKSKGSTELTWQLFPEGDTTQLKLVHSGIESFANDGPDFSRENFEAGWKEILGNSLKKFVGGRGSE